MLRALAALSFLALLAGCGARTGLEAQPRDAGPAIDAPTLRDAPRDVPDGSDAPCFCASDTDCDDGFQCTEDVCVDCACVPRPRPELCADDGFCNGVERCAPEDPRADSRGCAPGTPVRCADPVACTIDACDETSERCVFTPDVGLCPISHRCDPVMGCIARALAHDATNLYEIDLPGGGLRMLAPLPVGLTDLALHPDGRLFGAAGGALWLVDYEGGTASMVASVPGTSFNALDFAPDGRLYGAVDERVVSIDVVTGALATVASFPRGLVTSGDVAFVGELLYATTTADPFGTRPDVLVEVNVSAGTSRIVNAVGERCVWGLAPFGTTLYGLTCEGLLLRIDTTTARSTRLRTGLAEFYGAGAR